MLSQPSPPAPDSTLGEEADEGVALARSQSLTPILRRGAMISAGALVFSQLVTLRADDGTGQDPVPL